jgi:hypothetical protein
MEFRIQEPTRNSAKFAEFREIKSIPYSEFQKGTSENTLSMTSCVSRVLYLFSPRWEQLQYIPEVVDGGVTHGEQEGVERQALQHLLTHRTQRVGTQAVKMVYLTVVAKYRLDSNKKFYKSFTFGVQLYKLLFECYKYQENLLLYLMQNRWGYTCK